MCAFCPAACKHGGVCTLDEGHAGLHDASGYCQWADGEGMPRELADRKFAAMLLAGGCPQDIADALADL